MWILSWCKLLASNWHYIISINPYVQNKVSQKITRILSWCAAHRGNFFFSPKNTSFTSLCVCSDRLLWISLMYIKHPSHYIIDFSLQVNITSLVWILTSTQHLNHSNYPHNYLQLVSSPRLTNILTSYPF